MNRTQTYDIYFENLLEIADQLIKIGTAYNILEQDERNSVSKIENEFMLLSEELLTAKKTVWEQYRSVLESCRDSTGLKRPNDQRPSKTDLGWKEAVRSQEQCASRIRAWLSVKSQQAYEARQKIIREDQKRAAAIAAAAAEAARKKAEEEARLENERAEALVEALKNKYRTK